jgi:hypothetical protein
MTFFIVTEFDWLFPYNMYNLLDRIILGNFGVSHVWYPTSEIKEEKKGVRDN